MDEKRIADKKAGIEALKELQTMITKNRTPTMNGSHNIDHRRAEKLILQIYGVLNGGEL